MSATDLSFDIYISPQALAIQAGLKCYAEQPIFAGLTVRTWPRFNGRERGLVLSVSRGDLDRLLISFGECRGSDRIFVQHVETSRPMLNGPKNSDFTEKSYELRESFDELHVHAAVKYILKLVEQWKASHT